MKGGARKGAGRKRKSEEQDLIEKLTPYEPLALAALEEALKKGSSWAVKLFMEYKYGKPKETVTSKVTLEGFNIKDALSFGE